MPTPERIVLCTRGSALALAQTHAVVADCRVAFPAVEFRVEVIKTTGDKLQTASLAHAESASDSLPKGLFTKELENALLDGSADIAVHSLKDLPTELPEGLIVAATPRRADVRDVLLYRSSATEGLTVPTEPEWRPGAKTRWQGAPGVTLATLPPTASVATSSTRRAAQIQALRPDVRIVPIRGNVGTRLQKLAQDPRYDAILLAFAGLLRLGFFVAPKARLTLDPRLPRGHGFVPPPLGLLATILPEETLIPAVGQGALALETKREARPVVRELCDALNHRNTFAAITAERAFLRAMGGGCQSPVGAYARLIGHQLWLRAVSFQDGKTSRGEARRPVAQAEQLGKLLAAQLV